MESIAILGGSFNPVHNGHIKMATIVSQELGISKIILLPVGNPPHKSDLESSEHRYNMLMLAAKSNPLLTVSRLEIDRPGKTYTVDTLRELNTLYSVSDMYYIIGEDTLPELKTWRESETVLTTTRFAVVRRAGCSSDIEELLQCYRKKYGTEITVCKEKGLPVSSSEIRQAIRQGKDVSSLLPDGVWTYIRNSHLYEQ